MRLILLFVLFAIVMSYLTACATSQSMMGTCKSICRGGVLHFTDDNVECSCKIKGE